MTFGIIHSIKKYVNTNVNTKTHVLIINDTGELIALFQIHSLTIELFQKK